tara:strand:+ start:4877 stop:5101 length:225 start_codon:yes stop_codon:yes gene_type:complete
VVFKRNKKYYSLLRMEKPDYWVSETPLFTCGDKGLYPVFKVNGRFGRFPKNHQEFILKDISSELKEEEDEFSGL